MNNGDKQAMPMAHPSEHARHIESGLTKHEQFAAMFMASLLPHAVNESYDDLSGQSIEAANALLKAFEGEKK